MLLDDAEVTTFRLSSSEGAYGSTKPGKPSATPAQRPNTAKAAGGDRSFVDWLPRLPPLLSNRVASLEGHVLSLGDDVQRKELKHYVASSA